MFSAVASAFIIDVNSQLQPDPNDETAALLRVLIYKIDNTTFGHDVPALPQWNGPPRAMVDVQAILFASLAASLFSAFLAMLGKQWLNRYDSTDIRGTMTERSKSRQRKLDGVVAWYFNNVMESLPLMLQVALLLLSCALSRYLWEISMTVASIVIGITSFGVLSYLFIVIAATAYENCPYQTPGAHILRHYLLPVLRSTSSNFGTCETFSMLHFWWEGLTDPKSWGSASTIGSLLLFPLPLLSISLAIDLFRLGRAALRLLVDYYRKVYHGSITTFLRTRHRDQKTVTSDLRCVSWVLQTSLDKAFHLTALEYLAEMPELTYFDPSLVIGCFNVFISCTNVIGHKLVIVGGLEYLAKLSASCFLRTLRHSFTMDPTLSSLTDLRKHCDQLFDDTDSRDFHYVKISAAFFFDTYIGLQDQIELPADDHIQLAECVAEVAQVEYQRARRREVPSWTLDFARDSLSLDPPPSVAASCLKIIAISLGCDVSDIKIQDERCAQFHG